ncbi:hypothetical protein O181_013722 [Austropuccinia psidii MF-1]|uniref:Uncharacterized protein n=1 Tax=Austropuccinia psidii MF-1 TaxID=1389203 RepID=A0A9Q3BYV8_9BASI|nr:hypothetical protein [Austropuccinia psidii MF-1]
MHLSEEPGSTPEISSKANPQTKFPHDFLHNPGWNPMESQEPFGKSKKPSLNVPSGSQGHVGHEKQVDDMVPKGKTVRSQEPIEDCEKIHWLSSSISLQTKNGSCQFIKKTVVNDEDENMSPTQSETNYKPTRALSQIVSPPTLKFPLPRVCSINARQDSKGTRLAKLAKWKNVQLRRRHKDG